MHKPFLLILVVLSLFAGLGWPKNIEARVTSLWTEQVCTGDGTVQVNLQWGPIDYSVYAQWLDLAWLDNASRPKQLTSNTLVGPVNHLDWPGLQPASTYYVRVAQRSINDVVSLSTVFVVETAKCASTVPGDIVNLPGTGEPAVSSNTGSTKAKDDGDKDDSGNADEGNDDEEVASSSSSSAPKNQPTIGGR